jgi:hypothetical protein
LAGVEEPLFGACAHTAIPNKKTVAGQRTIETRHSGDTIFNFLNERFMVGERQAVV